MEAETVAVQCKAWSCYESVCWWLKLRGKNFLHFAQFLGYCVASVWKHFIPPGKTNPPPLYKLATSLT